MNFVHSTAKSNCLADLKEAERGLTKLRCRLEQERLSELPAYVLSIHCSKMLAKVYESVDRTAVKGDQA